MDGQSEPKIWNLCSIFWVPKSRPLGIFSLPPIPISILQRVQLDFGIWDFEGAPRKNRSAPERGLSPDGSGLQRELEAKVELGTSPWGIRELQRTGKSALRLLSLTRLMAHFRIRPDFGF